MIGWLLFHLNAGELLEVVVPQQRLQLLLQMLRPEILSVAVHPIDCLLDGLGQPSISGLHIQGRHIGQVVVDQAHIHPPPHHLEVVFEHHNQSEQRGARVYILEGQTPDGVVR